MSQITVRARLIAPEETRRAYWDLMAGSNTPLINEALRVLPTLSDFPKWRQKGTLPDKAAENLIIKLKEDSRFVGQPFWSYISAHKQVTYTFRSWLALQHRKQWKLAGKRLWLEILQPDETLAERAGHAIEALRKAAKKEFANVEAQDDPFDALFAAYRKTKSLKRQAAIAYLLKRGAKLSPEEEDLAKLAQRYRKTEIFIQRLETQLEASLPKGRDLTGECRLEALQQSIHSPPMDDVSYNAWKDALTTEPAAFPFPISIETVKWLIWSQDDKGNLLLQLSGLGQHAFKVYFDKAHQHWFQRFLHDQKTHQNGRDQYSAALFTLRAAKILWVPSEKHKDAPEPWNRYYLNLRCTVDTRAWTQEGSEIIAQEKAVKTAKQLDSMRAKESLTKNQQGYIRRLESTLDKLQVPFPRPSRPIYQGRPELLVGVSMGLEKVATVAVVNALTGKVITYRSEKQLLGENYPLLRRARAELTRKSHEGHRQRLRGGKRISQESDLGTHVDRLIAKAIVAIAVEHQAGSIVLPDLAYKRETIEAEVKQRAIEKVPDFVDGQKEYAKAYLSQVHRWPYARLQKCIISKAEQNWISCETAKQQYSGTPQDKARQLGCLAYCQRSAALAE